MNEFTSYVVIKERFINNEWMVVEVHGTKTYLKALTSQLDYQIMVMRLQGFLSESTAKAFLDGMLMDTEYKAGTMRGQII